MYNLESPGPNRGRMPGAASLHGKGASDLTRQGEFAIMRSDVQGTCQGCVNYQGPGPAEGSMEQGGPVGKCHEICPGPGRIFVRA